MLLRIDGGGGVVVVTVVMPGFGSTAAAGSQSPHNLALTPHLCVC